MHNIIYDPIMKIVWSVAYGDFNPSRLTFWECFDLVGLLSSFSRLETCHLRGFRTPFGGKSPISHPNGFDQLESHGHVGTSHPARQVVTVTMIATTTTTITTRATTTTTITTITTITALGLAVPRQSLAELRLCPILLNC